MTKPLQVVLELARILVMLVIFVTLLGWLGRNLYSSLFSWEESFNMYLTAGNFLLFFVAYRTKLQFGGWYKSQMNRRLSRPAIYILLSITAVLYLIPPAIVIYRNLTG
ncbi:hypothetical protein DNH61_02790 [Paenibacillus sambharensis]|uniref:Uncharacterized protein n=2 Tax=Paenibacillus sambharensis TaxID=1803190 RepID=A0A2W1LAM4_9BACL|nr:hypothetical protein DNH61_02790 [Paenibacillus sambharensis]